MAYRSLQEFISVLEEHNELIRIKDYFNPNLEITDLCDRFSKMKGGGKALLFENTDTPFPVLINAFGSEKRMQLALGVSDLDEIGNEIEDLLKTISEPKNSFFDQLKLLPQLSKIGSWMPKKSRKKGICQEVINTNPNLEELPILKTWPNDGGAFITLPMVNTIDPDTGIRNLGMYRMQVLSPNTTGMHWHKHKVGARHYQAYKDKGQKMPISVTIGGDPAYTYSATAPLPDQFDEYMLAGFLRKKKVELVKCITNDIYVPNDVDFVIEGYVDPQEDLIYEGPFGDHTGFYSLADWYPRFHVTCITHKKDAVYPTTIVGIPPMEDAYIGKATERIFLAPIKMTMLPEVRDMDLPFAGVAHNICIVKIEKTYAGQAHKVMSALWGAGQMMFNKSLMIVDEDVDIHDYQSVLKAVKEHFNPETDILFSKGPLDVLDHSSSRFSFGGKIGIDATRKYEEEQALEVTKKQFDSSKVLSEIVAVNKSYEALGLWVVAVSESSFHFENWIKEQQDAIPLEVHTVLIVDETIDIMHLFNTVWTAANHIEPIRDTLVKNQTLFIDGTRKNLEKDGFQRDWPNPVVMDDATIQAVDKKWDENVLGAFVESPSLYFKKQMDGEGAVAYSNDK